MTSRTRVVVVEDSVTVRKRLCEVLSNDPGLQVVGEAGDGHQAIELCERLRPDVVTMDMMLPVLNGLGATEHIMAHFPTPILVVSSSTNRGEMLKTYEVLAAGAVDVLEKPQGDEAEGVWERRLISAIKMVSRIRVITHPRARLRALESPRRSGSPISTPSVALPRHRFDLVAIGASTGGPGAILDILKGITLPFPLPILFVLHIGEPFGAPFAEWLESQVGVRVTYANDGDLVASGVGEVRMAPPGAHLAIADRRLRLTHDIPRHSCRPSVDVLFESAAREYGSGVVAALLTGMGRDGAAGLLQVRRAGGFTIAQDKDSCVVHGMPREAVLLGAVERELPLAEIGPALSSLAENGKQRQAK
jgi:two-component system, chemotaxis family, protein-glutamate methylesterase/glutaminase